MGKVKNNRVALNYFVQQMHEGKIEYKNGRLIKRWEPRRNWLPSPVYAEKLTTNGYYILRTVLKGKGNLYVMAHRVIWQYFNGTIPEDMEINHINGFKTDNRIENLELVTRKRNKEHARKSHLVKTQNLGTGRRKLSNNNVREIREMLQTGKYKQSEIASLYNVRPNQISRIKTGSRRADVMDNYVEKLNDFQVKSQRTLNESLEPHQSLANYAMGLCGESGEVIEMIKKGLFHGHIIDRQKITEELGDVMFYIAAIASTLSINLSDIANNNIEKLKKRYPDGFSQERSINRERMSNHEHS